jgi:hypothetical protein
MQEFPIAPGGFKPLWLLVPVVLVMAGVIAILTISALGARASRFTLSPEGLRLQGDLYGRLIPASQLRPDQARRIDARTSTELRPTRRTFGTGMPGYQSGWFRLANGERALLYLTDATKAVYVPTTAGYSVLLSPADPDGFLAALQRLR